MYNIIKYRVYWDRRCESFYFGDTRIFPFFKPFIIGQITIQVDATQEPYGIDRCEFFIDDEIKETITDAPYQWTWNTPAFFTHTIKVVAYDNLENSAADKITVKRFF